MRSKKISKMVGLMACLLGCGILVAEVTIRDVKTMTYGEKASVVISYDGVEKLQFFAINPSANVLTLDLPGVISLFDFDQLDLDLLERVEQVPLDPDSHRGVGVHFYLKAGVTYQIYESDPGTLVLFFERTNAGDHAVETVVVEPMSDITVGQPSAAEGVTLQTLNGPAGPQHLTQVAAAVGERVGEFRIAVDGDFEMNHFRLTDPPRFAINLKGVICALTEGDLIIESDLVQRVRVRQFQVHPETISRMVLELTRDDVDVRVEREGNVAVVRFAASPVDLDQQLVVFKQPDKTTELSEEIVTEDPVAVSVETVEIDSIESNDAVPMQDAELKSEIPPVIDTVEVVADDSTDIVPQRELAPQESEVSELPVKAAFDLPSDIDAELAEFKTKKTFYDHMKNDHRNNGSTKPIEMTNQTIEEALTLGEARSMQEDYEEPSQSSLFDEVETMQDDSYVRIDGGTGKYHGFEIQKIDVKDANVVDLLRFLADQVGFNLYVDPSVQNLKATYSFRNIPWDQAMDIILRNANLDWEFENGVLRVATTKKFKEEAIARRELLIERELSVPPETVTFPLSYAKVKEIVPIIEQYLSPRGTILYDERTNTLIIEDIPKRMVAIRTLIRRLDTRIPQVDIEARIVETTKRFIRELGVQWGLSAEYSPERGTDTGVTFPNRVGAGGPVIGSTSPGGLAGGYAVNFPVVADNPAGLGLSLGNFLNTFQLDIALQLLENEGQGQIISAPKVITQNNKTAVIKNGTRVPTQTIQRGTITVRYIEAVLQLEVTPQVTNEKTIILDLVVDKSEADFSRDVLGNPVINIRRAETRVLVKDGGTAVIGGIFVLNEQSSSQGVPGLKKIPFIRRLFGSESNRYDNQELLIFITPRIVKY